MNHLVSGSLVLSFAASLAAATPALAQAPAGPAASASPPTRAPVPPVQAPAPVTPTQAPQPSAPAAYDQSPQGVAPAPSAVGPTTLGVTGTDGAAPGPGRFGAVDRDGLVVGFSLGGGVLSASDCSDCDELSGAAASLQLGGMVNPRLAILWDASAVSHTDTDSEVDFTVVNVVNVVAAQYWLTPSFWIKAGLGFGRIGVVEDGEGDLSETGGAALAALGLEVMQRETFALDLTLRASRSNYEEASVSATSLSVGLNWY